MVGWKVDFVDERKLWDWEIMEVEFGKLSKNLPFRY